MSVKTFFIAAVSAALGAAAVLLATSQNTSAPVEDVTKPLYWVAPMDPSYRRDGPGKSPMGMDLIPVYAEADQSMGAGTVRISADVVNNLGVRTARVERRRLHSQINTVGYVQYDQDRLIHIHPRVEGWVEKLYIKAAGDPVRQGEPIYQLYSPQLVNAQEELRLAMNTGDGHLVRAAKNNLRALKFPEQAIAELVKTGRVQQTVTFYAPQSGVVDALKIREGFFVQPGTSMMSIGSLDQVWVEAEVFERQVALIKVGQPVSMRLDYLPGRDWQGVVDYVYPSLDEQTRTAKVRLRFNNADGVLKPNMFAQISIHTESAEPALVVPREAVIRTGSMDRVVMALGDGRFKSLEVIVGRSDGAYIEILGGVLDGEKVVTSAQFLLDSESSKSSDFKRMDHDQHEPVKTVWVKARVNSVMRDHRMVNLDHDPVVQWRWPKMTMDFLLHKNVDINGFQPGRELYIEIEKLGRDSGYQIIAVSERAEADNEATVSGVIESLMAEHKMLRIAREAVNKWDRPAAVVDFIAADQVDLSALAIGQRIHFRFAADSGEFVITEIFSIEESSEVQP